MITDKELDRLVNDKTLLGFNWPPKMPSFPFKKKRKYIHEVTLSLKKYPQVTEILIYSSEKKGKNAEKVLNEALNVSGEYTRREIPVTEEEFIT